VGAARHSLRTGAGRPVRSSLGSDLFGLREYEIGDDLRRVHWPASARSQTLILREDEVSWEAETTTVGLDTRRSRYSEESFETAVDAGASVVAAVCGLRRRVRLLTSDGFEVRSQGAGGHTRAMDFLAVVARTGPGRHDRVLDGLRRRGRGPVAVVTGDL